MAVVWSQVFVHFGHPAPETEGAEPAQPKCCVSCGCSGSTEVHSRAVEHFHAMMMRIERVGPEDEKM